MGTALGEFLHSDVAARKGEYGLAAKHLRAALDSSSWESKRSVMRWGGWTVFLDRLDFGTVYVHQERSAILVGKDTWDVINSDTNLVMDFLNQMVRGAAGMKFLTMDSGKYGAAARALATQRGDDVVLAKDAITQLDEHVRSLVIQAQGVNGKATSVQLQAFAVRYADAELRFAELDERLGRLRALLDLAGATIESAA